jgi:hypothetical protein
MFSPFGLYDAHHSSLPSTSSLKSGIFGVWKKKKREIANGSQPSNPILSIVL